MEAPFQGEAPIELHARPAKRTLELGGDVAALRSATAAAVAELLGHPAGMLLTSSCSTAFEAVAVLLPLEPGDEVVVPAFTFASTVAPFVARGCTIRFADVDGASMNADPASVIERIGPRTRAVVVMHYGGVAVCVEPWESLAVDQGIAVVEDAAHALFGRSAGRPLGTLGRFGALSFHRTKNLSAHDGGALVVNQEADLERAIVAVDKGMDRFAFERGLVRSYEWQGLGGAWRMGDAEVAYLAEELTTVHARQARRQEVWAAYASGLASWASELGVDLPVLPEGAEHPAHLFHLVVPKPEDRSGFVAHLASLGVVSARHYSALTATPFGARLVLPSDGCPVAEARAPRLVRIPLHHDLDDRAVERVIAAVTSWTPRRSSAAASEHRAR